MKSIRLNISKKRLHIVIETLLQYADLCTMLCLTSDITKKDNYTIRLSIAMELYYKLNSRFHKPDAPDKHTQKLTHHQAIVLLSAFCQFIMKDQKLIFEQNAIEILKNELDQQIKAQSTVVTP